MRVPLTIGAYTARSVIAEAQRCVNLYAERNPEDAESPFTYYNAPGLVALGTAPNKPARCLYWANNNQFYYVAGNTVYSVSPTWVLTSLGTIGTEAGIASMIDNGTTLVLVDGSARGYQIDLTTNAFSPITEAANGPAPGTQGVYGFYGATRADVIDGFIILNQPNTRNFYSTYNNEVVFDSLYFAAKDGYPDPLVSVIVSRREVWLIGERTTEIWFDAGAADFPFQIVPGPFVQHGCSAPYSVAQIDGAVFWLSQDQAGNNILARAQGYLVKPISTQAIIQEWAKYPTTADAQGFCFQVGGHAFYQINFPSADKSWRWDETTQQWHEAVWTDANGESHRHRISCAAYAYGGTVGADWETGQLYQIDPEAHTDAGTPMYFRRGFPHLLHDGRQVIYPGFTLDIEVATSPDTVPETAPMVSLRWSDTRGRTWGQPVDQSLGATGEYLTQPQWNRLGRARDRVFEVFGVIPGRIALNGGFLDPPPIPLVS